MFHIKKKKNEVDFAGYLYHKKISILTLDERWHELFPEYEKTPSIKRLENKLNHLLQRQGKLNTDVKDMKKLKKKLLDQIVSNMDEHIDDFNRKKQEKSQQLIQETNMKIQDSKDELLEIPDRIKEVNNALLIESMQICYAKLKQYNQDVEEADEWIEKVREKLKERILEKQEKEIKSQLIYTYMHDMLGPEIIELFDDNN